MDSAVPTGAFSHSLGFETYLSDGVIDSEDSFRHWLTMFIHQQLTFTDAIAIREVYAADTFTDITDLDHELTALTLPVQVRQAGITMGRRLLEIGAQTISSGWIEEYREGIASGVLFGHQASVWGVIARHLDVDVDQAVAQHLQASIISLTQNAVRAIPLGQNAGQRIIAGVRAEILSAVDTSGTLQREDLGAVAPGLEIAQMRHERQLARMFMS